MPGRLKPSGARKQIQGGTLEPLYLITGDDQAEKTGLVTAFNDVVEPDLRAFNVERVYGGEIEVQALLDTARILPMLAPRRIIIVMQADRLFVPKRQSEQAERDLEALEAYVKTPEPATTMVFVADAFDKRRKLSKALVQHAVWIECGGLEDAAEAMQWIRARAAEQAMTIEPAAAALLLERAGLNVARLRAEIERACLFAAGRSSLTAADVAEVAGAATPQDDWAMVNAIRDGTTAAALRELALLVDAGAIPLVILGQLRSFVERAHLRDRWHANRPPMSADAQGRAFDALLRTDLALKTSAGDPQVLLERLVVELCEGS